MTGVIISETNAPRIVPGIHIKPNLNPIPYSILFCLAYVAVDATALLNAAKRLLLAANVGGNPAKVITGTAIITPPSPIIEPSMPAAKYKLGGAGASNTSSLSFGGLNASDANQTTTDEFTGVTTAAEAADIDFD